MPVDNYAGNINFKQVYQDPDITLYMPVDITSFHKSREMAMQAQERYSNAGISKENLKALADSAIEQLNNELNKDKLRTNMTVLWNNILARMQFPVDEHCAVRMGAIATLMPDEPEHYMNDNYTAHKMRLALQNPNLYAFFLNMGVAFTPEYTAVLRTLSVEEYLMKRNSLLAGMKL